MKDNFSQHHNKIIQIVHNSFLPILYSKLNAQLELLNAFNTFITDYRKKLYSIDQENNLIGAISNIKFFNIEIFKLIKNKYENTNFNNFEQTFSDFELEINKLLSVIDEQIIEEQSKECFIISEQDSWRIKYLKTIKKFFYKISQFPIYFKNIFLRIFRKKTQPARKWNHKIPLKNLYHYCIKYELNSKLFTLTAKTNAVISETSFALLKAYESTNKNFNDFLHSENENALQSNSITEEYDEKLISRIRNTITELESDSTEIVKSSFEKLNDLYRKVGTIELPGKNFNDINTKEREKKLSGYYNQIEEGWHNTLFVLFDDWRSNDELFILRDFLIENYHSLLNHSHSIINETISPWLTQIKRALEKLRIDILRYPDHDKNFKEFINLHKNEIQTLLKNEFIPKLTELLYNENFAEKVEEINLKLKDSVNNIIDKRGFVKGAKYDEPIKSSEIDFVSLKEVISFEILPAFLKETSKLKIQLTSDIQNINNEIISIEQIFEFNIDAATSVIDEKENEKLDIKPIVIESLDRIIGKTIDVGEQIKNIEFTLQDYLERAAEDFNSDIMELTKAGRVYEIKLRITKAVAVQKAALYKNDLIKKTKNLIPVLIESTKKLNSDIHLNYFKLKKKFGLAAEPVLIASEISDFLAETQSAIEKLPFVYKRLFEIEPLTNEKFFILREENIKALKKSYNNWTKGRFAPIVIVGENGSGKTTLINYYLNVLPRDTNILRITLKEAIYTEEKLLSLFGKILNNEFKGYNEIIDYLNSLNNQQILVFEDIQHLFLRKVGGFNMLKIFFQMISRTNKKIFWITCSSLYSWQYLDKTLDAADYFGYVIRLENLSDFQTINMILKRHSVSGYNIYFEPSAEDDEKKSFKKLSDAEKQEFLKKNYFIKLNKFAHNNLSLALLFWLRSTKEVSKDTITIGSLDNLDFSFLSILSREKFFTLSSLLLHGGLTESEHALIFNESIDQSRSILTLLKDDGIIIKEANQYFVNPFLYRQVVNLLQQKNIIH
jgi:energy-coupling factor transporter ATP-binding protein EcfA2